jgi:hypothetical protein
VTATPPRADLAGEIADRILADVGDQMGEMYAALPDLISDRYGPYQDMDLGQRKAFVQAVAEEIGGEGYVFDYPVT